MAKKLMKWIKRIMFWGGSTIAVSTHIALIATGRLEMIVGHAAINLFAATMIIGQRFIKVK